MSFFEAMFGDDFPDAFARDGRSCKSKRTLLDLPAEILEVICQSLSKLDLKRLRLTSRELAGMVELRIDRVYISPNRANLDCLNNILNHPSYCLQVQELVWDDARLEQLPTFDVFRERIGSDQAKARVALEDHLSTLFQNNAEDDAEFESIGVQDCLQDDGELTDIGKAILLSANDEKSKDIIANRAAIMSVEDSYVLYQKVYQDEGEIVKRGWDVTALQRALEQLPNVRRITITSEIWRPWHLIPTYDTPFHRALPAGFRKPSVWPWVDRSHIDSPDLFALDESAQHLPAKWRGYSIIMSSLASRPVPNLQEFVLDTGSENIGLPKELFASPNLDYTNSIQVFSTIPLKKLQLSIVEHPIRGELRDRNIDDIGLLKGVISVTPNLEDLDLKWSLSPNYQDESFDEFFDESFLRARCPGLKNIALRHARLSHDWLYHVITSLGNLVSVTLDKIYIETRTYREVSIFHRFQQHYAGRCFRGPNFTWIEYLRDPADPESVQLRTSKLWAVVDDELDAFLYDGGELPFESLFQGGAQGALLKADFGWIMNGRDPTVHISKSNESIVAAIAMRNPWPIDGSTATVHPQWRIY